jgi:hypothetical protein
VRGTGRYPLLTVADPSFPRSPPHVARPDRLLPKPICDGGYLGCTMFELGRTVHQRPQVSLAGDGDGYSLGYSLFWTRSTDLARAGTSSLGMSAMSLIAAQGVFGLAP